MSDPIYFVTTTAIRQAVKGREEQVLDGIGVDWREGRPHINCPYRDHADDNASWRWDSHHAKAFCTCTKADSIFDVVMKVQGCDFEAAKVRVAELLKLSELIRTKRGSQGDGRFYQATDAASLLGAPADRRDDSLPANYLAHRLGVAVDAVPIPSTSMIGLKALGYYDPPAQGSKAKPKLVGEFPCAVFATVAADSGTHAHRIYLAPAGEGKADLGVGPDGRPREPKKSAKLIDGDNVAGRSVLWGDPRRAPHTIITEGIETGAALALAFAVEIKAGDIAVAAAISAGGMEAFQAYEVTTRITVAADRDEAAKSNGRAGSRRGEQAARTFAARSGNNLSVLITLPGEAGSSQDWLYVLISQGPEAVRSGIFEAELFVPTAEELATERNARERTRSLKNIASEYPVPDLNDVSLSYAFTPAGKVWLHKTDGSRKNEERGESERSKKAVATPFTIRARLRNADKLDAYGLRVLVQGMDGNPRAIDIDRSDLARVGAQEVRARLLAAGLRAADDGETIVIAALKAADPEREIIVVNRPGWHSMAEFRGPVFVAPSGIVLGASDEIMVELAQTVRLPRGVSGSLGEWRKAAREACAAANCPHWTLGLLAGFAGSLISLAKLDTCGISLSGLSSAGKTLAQKLAASCWSTPEIGSGLLQSMRTTENALEHLAEASNGTVLILDEVGHADGKAIGRMIYSIASGVGKARLSRDSVPRERAEWSTFALLSGETSLEAKVTADGGVWVAGMAVRQVDIDVNDVNRKVDTKTLRKFQQIISHYGHAGPAFVEGLIREGYHREPGKLAAAISAAAKRIAGDDADSARLRAATTMAVLQVAGTLAKQFGLINKAVPVAHSVNWAWARFVESSDGRALTPEDQALGNMRRWIAERWDVTIKSTEVNADHGQFEPRGNNREAVGWYDGDTIYLPPPRAREAAGGAVKEQFLSRLLAKRDLLARRHDERRVAVRWVPGIGKIDCFALRRSEFGRNVKGSHLSAVQDVET